MYLRPDHALAAVTVADLYEQLKQNEAAIEAYELVPENSPMRESANIQAGLSLDALGRSDEAVNRLQEIVAANPKDVDALSALGSLQRSAKKFEDAAADLRQGDRADRASPIAATGRCSISAEFASSASSNGRRPKPISRRRSNFSPTSRWS